MAVFRVQPLVYFASSQGVEIVSAPEALVDLQQQLRARLHLVVVQGPGLDAIGELERHSAELNRTLGTNLVIGVELRPFLQLGAKSSDGAYAARIAVTASAVAFSPDGQSVWEDTWLVRSPAFSTWAGPPPERLQEAARAALLEATRELVDRLQDGLASSAS